MKQSMKKAALVLMLALAVLLVPQWSNTALAVTTPSDITTGSALPPAPPLDDLLLASPMERKAERQTRRLALRRELAVLRAQELL